MVKAGLEAVYLAPKAAFGEPEYLTPSVQGSADYLAPSVKGSSDYDNDNFPTAPPRSTAGVGFSNAGYASNMLVESAYLQPVPGGKGAAKPADDGAADYAMGDDGLCWFV